MTDQITLHKLLHDLWRKGEIDPEPEEPKISAYAIYDIAAWYVEADNGSLMCEVVAENSETIADIVRCGNVASLGVSMGRWTREKAREYVLNALEWRALLTTVARCEGPDVDAKIKEMKESSFKQDTFNALKPE